MILDEVDGPTRATLERFAFDADRFEELRARVRSGALSPASNVVAGTVEPPLPTDVERLPAPGSDAWRAADAAGREALAAGRVAQVVLAGGMATRFGGVVKGTVEALDGRSFLGWKLGETARLGRALGAEIPVALMTSFQTDEETRRHVAGLDVPEPLVFTQSVAVRLTEAGDLFREHGTASLYAPGHGDLPEALRRSGTLAALRSAGVAHVAISNVDNLGARLDPVVVGAHLRAATPMTAEVARKEGDVGGAPARVDGRLLLLEGPQIPPGFDHDAIEVFNTNSTLIAAEALEQDVPLGWLFVRKQVDGRTAVQLERLYHQLSWSLPTQYLEVDRAGPRGRFFPVKEPDDLERVRPALREMLAAPLA